jgi:hypothetical protein
MTNTGTNVVKAAQNAQTRITFLENREKSLEKALAQATERLTELEASNPPRHTAEALKAAPVGSKLANKDEAYGDMTKFSEDSWAYELGDYSRFSAGDLLGIFANEGWPTAELVLPEAPSSIGLSAEELESAPEGSYITIHEDYRERFQNERIYKFQDGRWDWIWDSGAEYRYDTYNHGMFYSSAIAEGIGDWAGWSKGALTLADKAPSEPKLPTKAGSIIQVTKFEGNNCNIFAERDLDGVWRSTSEARFPDSSLLAYSEEIDEFEVVKVA